MPGLRLALSCESFGDDEGSEDFEMDIPELERVFSRVPSASDGALKRERTMPAPMVAGRPDILVGRLASIDDMEVSASDDVPGDRSVRVEMVEEFRAGDPIGTSSFGTSWGALLRIQDRPEQAPVFGHPTSIDASAIRWRLWLQSAGFFAFLRACGALRQGRALPRTPAELQKECGIVPVKDDLFCGFWCLAHLRRSGLADVFRALVRELDEDRLLVARARERKEVPSADAKLWQRVWGIAYYGLQRLETAERSGKDWDKALLPAEQDMGENGHAAAYVTSKIDKEFSMTEIMLTPGELAKLCARLKLNAPVMTVAPAESFWGEEYAQAMLVAAAQKAFGRFLALEPENDEHADQMREAGHTLRVEGYRLVIADNARVHADSLPLKDLRFPFIVLLGEHFFVLEAARGNTTSLPPKHTHRKRGREA
mmetsp:Transcript_54321/g.151245  ORF Transcript_54321/g.151245 Transcript_54321/m.151245 type:complete len:426 (-) Transcript_54321:22-1299(-)